MRPVAAVSEPGTPLVQMDPFLLCQVQAGLPQTAHLHHHHDISSIFNSSTPFIEQWLTISTYSIRKQSGVVMPSLMLKRRFKTVLLYFHPAKWSTMVVWFDSSLENCLEQIVKPLPRNFRRVSISPSCRLSDNCLRSYWSLMCRSSSGNLHLFNLLCCSHSPLPQLPVRVVGEPRHPCLPAVSWAWSCSPCNVDIWKKNRFIWLYL